MESSSLVNNSVFVTLALLLLVSSSSAEASRVSKVAVTNLVNQVCPYTVDPALCTEALTSDPRSASADMFGLGNITINLTLKSAVENSHFIHTQQTLMGTNPAWKASFATCATLYADAIKNINAAATQFGRRDYTRVYSSYFKALEDVEYCDDTFYDNGRLMATTNHRVVALLTTVSKILDLLSS